MKKFIVCLLTLALALTLVMGTASAGYAAEQEELNEPAEQEEEVKRDISEYTVELDGYFVMATGEPFNPEVIKVRTNEGETGVVIRQNSEFPDRPVIRIMEDQYGKTVKERKIKDLVHELTVFVESVIDE